jgi:Spy/CpxP family protein refolding chaperone
LFIAAAMLAVLAMGPVVQAADAPKAAEPAAAVPAAPAAAPAAPAAAPAAPTAVPAAAPAAEPKKTEKPALDPQMAVMVKECKLSDEQVTKLTDLAAAAKAEAEAWQKANADKVEAFNKALMAAKQTGDQAAIEKVMKDNAPLMDQNQAMRTKFQKAVADVLTVDQQATWQGFVLWANLTPGMKLSLGLSDEQVTKIRPLCDAAAKQLLTIKPEDPKFMENRMAAQEGLIKAIKTQVLTPDQAKKLEAQLAPEMPPPAEKAPPAAEKAPPAAPVAPVAPAPVPAPVAPKAAEK